MNTISDEQQVSAARTALVSDIQEIKAAGKGAVARVRSKMPWIVGSACGLVLLGVVVAVAKERRHSFEKPRRPLIRTAVRAAALLATNALVKRYMERVVNRIAPKPELTSSRVEPTADPAER